MKLNKKVCVISGIVLILCVIIGALWYNPRTRLKLIVYNPISYAILVIQDIKSELYLQDESHMYGIKKDDVIGHSPEEVAEKYVPEKTEYDKNGNIIGQYFFTTQEFCEKTYYVEAYRPGHEGYAAYVEYKDGVAVEIQDVYGLYRVREMQKAG